MNTIRENALLSLRHIQPGKIPYHVSFTQKAYTNMVRFYSDPDFESKIGNCLTMVSIRRYNEWKEIKPDIWEDEFGVLWNRTIDKDIGNVCNCVVTPETLDKYQFPDSRDPDRYGHYPEIIRKKKEKTLIVANLGFSLFERAWTLMGGMDHLLVNMIERPAFVHSLFDKILMFNIGVIESVCNYDIDVFRFGDDWGMQTGLITGPKLWREFIKPRITEMYGAVKKKGKFVMIHSCGKVDELFPELIEIGVDVFNPFQPEVMDVFGIKHAYGDKLSFFGGISTQKTLPYGTVAQVRNEVKRLLKEIGKNGGYIAAPSHDIPGDAKPENIAAMLEILQNQ